MGNSLAEIAYRRRLSLKEAKLLYKRGLKKIHRCLDLYKTNQDIFQDVRVKIYLKKPLNTFLILQHLLNMDIVRAFEIKPEVLLYMLVVEKYRAEKIFKLPSDIVQYIRSNVRLEYLSKGQIK